MPHHVLDQSVSIVQMQDVYINGRAAVQQVIDDGDLPEDGEIILEIKSLLINYHGVLSKHRETIESQHKNVDSPKNTPVKHKTVDNVKRKLNFAINQAIDYNVNYLNDDFDKISTVERGEEVPPLLRSSHSKLVNMI